MDFQEVSPLSNLKLDIKQKPFSKKRFVITGGIIIFIYLFSWLRYGDFLRSLVGGEKNIRISIVIFILALLLLSIFLLLKRLVFVSQRKYLLNMLRIIAIVSTSLFVYSFLLFLTPILTLGGYIMTGIFAPESGLGGVFLIVPIFGAMLAIALTVLLSWWLVPLIPLISKQKKSYLFVVLLSGFFLFFLTPVLIEIQSSAALPGRYQEMAKSSIDQIKEESINLAKTTRQFSTTEVSENEWEATLEHHEDRYRVSEPKKNSLMLKSKKGTGEFSVSRGPYGYETYIAYRKEGNIIWERNDLCSISLTDTKRFSPDYSKFAGSVIADEGCGNEQLIYNSENNHELILPTRSGRILGWVNNSTVLLSNNEPTVSSFLSAWLWSYNIDSDEFKPISSTTVRIYTGTNFTLSPSENWILINNEEGGYRKGGEVWIISVAQAKQITLTGFPCEIRIGCSAVMWGLKENEIYVREPKNHTISNLDGTLTKSKGRIWKITLPENLLTF